ncbi:uncharacterized protein METZ01_LOCUS431181, partial [marine metagenome]
VSLLGSLAESKTVILTSLLSAMIIFGIAETGMEEISEIDDEHSPRYALCGLGYYSDDGTDDSGPCTPADPGYYVDTLGATNQTACAPGTYQPSSGQASCLDADAGYYSSAAPASASVLAAGTYHTCAVLDDGSLYCWGDNNYGQLGDGTDTNSHTPLAVNNLPIGYTATSVSGGNRHTCTVLDDG